MPSVLGLLEAREKRVREEIAQLREEAERAQAALGDAERALQRLVDARVTVAEVLAGPHSAVAEPTQSAVARSLVPQRAEGMAVSVLTADYQRILSLLESEAGRGHALPALAVALGMEAVPAKVEGLRSKAKRCRVGGCPVGAPAGREGRAGEDERAGHRRAATDDGLPGTS